MSAAGEELTAGVITAGLLGVVLVSAMWWLYFDVVSRAAERMLASLTGRLQTAMARDSYSYIHFLMVWGIVLVALGLKKTLLDVGEPLKAWAAVALLGGLALYLVAFVLFRLRNMGTLNVQRLVVSVILLALIPVALVLPSITTLTIVVVITVALVAYEGIRYRDSRHMIRHHGE